MIMTKIILRLYICITLMPLIHTQPMPHSQKLWQYGNGIIQDFDWVGKNIVLAVSTGLWEVDDSFNHAPVTFDPRFNQPATNVESGKGWTHGILNNSDGTHFLTQDDDNVLRIRDSLTGSPVLTLPINANTHDLAWQPEGSLLAIQYYDKAELSVNKNKVALWDTNTGQLIELIGGYINSIAALSWRPDGKILALSLTSGKILFVDIIDKSVVNEILLTQSFASTLNWSPDGGKIAATIAAPTNIMVWKTDTLQQLVTPKFTSELILSSWNNNSATLALAWRDGSISTLNINTGEQIIIQNKVSKLVDQFVVRLVWHDNLLTALNFRHYLRIFDTMYNKVVWDSLAFPGNVDGLAVSNDGARIALAYGSNAEIVILDGKSGELQQKLDVPTTFDVTDMSWNLKGDELAVGTTLILYIWRFNPNILPQMIQVDGMLQPVISWSPKDILAVVWRKQFDQEELRFIDGKTGLQLTGTRQISGLTSVRWSFNGLFLAVYMRGANTSGILDRIDVFDIQNNRIATVKLPFNGNIRAIPTLSFSWLRDSSGLVGFTTKGSLWRWVRSNEDVEILVISSDNLANSRFTLSPNYQNLIAVTDTQAHELRIIRTEDGEPIMSLRNFSTTPYFFDWSNKNTIFIYDTTLQAYDIQIL